MKCKIIKSIPPDQLEARVPPAFRDQIHNFNFGNILITILLFPHDKRDVIHSRHVLKALSKIEDKTENLVALAGSFTQESEQALLARGAKLFSINEFFWTDKSYKQIKVFSGATVKKPKIRNYQTKQ